MRFLRILPAVWPGSVPDPAADHGGGSNATVPSTHSPKGENSGTKSKKLNSNSGWRLLESANGGDGGIRTLGRSNPPTTV